MPRIFRLQSLLFCLFLLVSSCAISQPRIKTGTKNKKANALFFEAVSLANQGEAEDAINKLDKALKKDDQFIDAYLLKGDIYKNLKNYDESKAAYRQALAINDQLVDVHYYLGQMFFQAEQYDSVMLELGKYIKTDPGVDKIRIAEKMMEDANFIKYAKLNPVPFNPINAGPNINSRSMEYFPGITVDGEYFVFTRQVGQYPQEDFYICKKINDTTWGPARNLGPPVNTEENEGSITISADGQFIFFTSCNRSKRSTFQGQRSGADPREIYPGCDLYFSKLDGDKWSIPRHLGPVVNSKDWDSAPSLSFDGLNLYFASTRPGGFGGSDIWMSTFDGSKFLEPVNLGPTINTAYNEETPFIHPDNQTLYFSSSGWPGMGKMDFFVSKRNADGSWGQPVNLGYPINSPGDEKGLMVNSAGNLAYFSSDSRPDSHGMVDIYQFELPKEYRPKKLSYVKAIVLDDETSKPLEATAELFNLQTGLKVISTGTNSITGSFLVVLQEKQDYALNVSKEGYLFHSENFSLKTSTKDEPYILTVRLKKIKPGQNVVLNNVFYDVNSYELRNESLVELDKLYEFLNANQTVKIEIGGHTDNTGNANDNKKLSENRAKSVMDYLIKKGISADRLSFKGYGSSKPIAGNENEEGRQKNRRTEYRIIAN